MSVRGVRRETVLKRLALTVLGGEGGLALLLENGSSSCQSKWELDDLHGPESPCS
jgi:hypothetical protein